MVESDTEFLARVKANIYNAHDLDDADRLLSLARIGAMAGSAYKPTVFTSSHDGSMELVAEDVPTGTLPVFLRGVEELIRMDAPYEVIGFRVYPALPKPEGV